MIITKCDKCGKEIPIVTKKNSFGIEIKVLDAGHVRCAEWNVDRLFDGIDLCKSCAEIISTQADNAFLRMRMGARMRMCALASKYDKKE